MALTFLRWLSFSARPLKLDELAEVAGVDFESKPFPRFYPDLRYNPDIILIVCSSLVVTSSDGGLEHNSLS